MATIFTRIVNGEIPSYKIAETNDYFAFLDINPLVKGHTLVIPKKETDYIFNIADPEYEGLFLFTKKIAIAIKRVIPCEKVGIAVIGLEILHAHIHLIPLQTMQDINFSNPKLKLSPAEFNAITQKIARAL